jgi:tetratricopeptide (TPR) repeat protein
MPKILIFYGGFMIRNQALWRVLLVVGFLAFIMPAKGENFTVILRGKVLMPDGTAPKFRLAVERICSDEQGSAPGPLVDEKGDYLWKMDVDPMRTRVCVIRATHAGYTSTSVDISALSGYLSRNFTLQTIVISSLTDDPYAIIMSESSMPGGRAKSALKAANKALDEHNYSEAKLQFQAAMEAAPKYAIGWHAMGVILERENAMDDASAAYKHAIETDPKLLPPYMTLIHLCIKTKDWKCAAETADALIKADTKHKYPDTLLHRAVALYGLKDLDNASASVQEALRLDPNHIRPRAEYVYGRILEAKGDIERAREHISKYLELDKEAPDSNAIKQHLQNLGKPGNLETDPELEYP